MAKLLNEAGGFSLMRVARLARHLFKVVGLRSVTFDSQQQMDRSCRSPTTYSGLVEDSLFSLTESLFSYLQEVACGGIRYRSAAGCALWTAVAAAARWLRSPLADGS